MRRYYKQGDSRCKTEKKTGFSDLKDSKHGRHNGQRG
jgi:hypothetical protein